MNKVILSVLSVVMIATVQVVFIAQPALAWHPKAAIEKRVLNQTLGGALSDADTDSQAVSAKPGDILKYVIEVRNDGQPDSRGYNDMASTVLTDKLPAGVELVDNPSLRSIKVEIGLLKPGQKVTKEYAVKVVALANGYVKNEACVTGDSTINDNPQKECDLAIVKVTIPETPTPTPTPQPTPETPKVIPKTGPEVLLGGITGLSALGFATHSYLRSKRDLITSLLER